MMSKPSGYHERAAIRQYEIRCLKDFPRPSVRATVVPKTNMYCLLENGVNVRKSSIATIIEPHHSLEG
jgi:hypothetical protein